MAGVKCSFRVNLKCSDYSDLTKALIGLSAQISVFKKERFVYFRLPAFLPFLGRGGAAQGTPGLAAALAEVTVRAGIFLLRLNLLHVLL